MTSIPVTIPIPELAAEIRAPLLLDASARFARPPEVVLPKLLDHQGMTNWFPMLHKVVEVSHAEDGHCTERACSIRGMGTLNERIVWWDPSKGYSYSIDAEGVPVKDHTGVLLVEADGSGSVLEWRQHFNWRGLLRPAVFKMMMPAMMKKGLATFGRDLGISDIRTRWHKA